MIFDVNELLENKTIQLKNSTIPQSHIMSLATALPTVVTEKFNIRQKTQLCPIKSYRI